MGKRIIMQRRGKGSKTYRVRPSAFKIFVGYTRDLQGEGEVIQLVNSPAHSAPLAKIKYANKNNETKTFFIPAFNGMIEGQKINLDSENKEIKNGNIMRLKNLGVKTKIYCVESRPGDGGKFIKTGGNSAEVNKILSTGIVVLFPSKKIREFNENCRAVVGIIAGHGRLEKPIVKAGKAHYMKKAKNKLWPRTSACKMNVVDHPFGSGRGKVAKQRIAKRNAPPGARVGKIRPDRTGRKR
nr:50S ribosomal protein L2P [uncultured archaeon]